MRYQKAASVFDRSLGRILLTRRRVRHVRNRCIMSPPPPPSPNFSQARSAFLRNVWGPPRKQTTHGMRVERGTRQEHLTWLAAFRGKTRCSEFRDIFQLQTIDGDKNTQKSVTLKTTITTTGGTSTNPHFDEGDGLVGCCEAVTEHGERIQGQNSGVQYKICGTGKTNQTQKKQQQIGKDSSD